MDNITTYIIRYIGDTTGLKPTEAEIKKLQTSTEQLGIGTAKVSKILSTDVTTALDREGKMVTQTAMKWKDAGGQIHTTLSRNDKVMKDTISTTRGLADNLWTLASRAMLTIPIWLALRSVVMGFIGAVSDAGKFLVELEDAMIEIRMVGNATDTELNSLKESVLALGVAYGVTAKDSLEAAKIFMQQGLSVAETTNMVRASMIASQLLGFSVSEAAENLTAAMRAYKIEAEDAIGVVDKWMAVQKDFAVTAKDLAEATKTAGATAAGFGIEYEQYLGHITAIIEVTRKSGSQAANALQAIYTRMFSQAKKAIQEIGHVPVFLTDGKPTFEPTNIYREASDVIEDLAASWQTLTEAQKINLATQIGSRRQAAPTMALFENYNRVIEAQVTAYKSAGEAARDWVIKQDSATVKLKQMQASWAQMVSTVGDTSVWKGLLDILGNLAIAMTLVINRTKGLQAIISKTIEPELVKKESALAEAQGLQKLIELRDKYNKKTIEAVTPEGRARAASIVAELDTTIGARTITSEEIKRLQREVEEWKARAKYIPETTQAAVSSKEIADIENKRKIRRKFYSEETLSRGVFAEIEAKENARLAELRSEREKNVAVLQEEVDKRMQIATISAKETADAKLTNEELEKRAGLQEIYDTTAKEELQLVEHRANIMRNLGADEQEVLKYMISQWETNEKLKESTEAYYEKRKLIYQLTENETKLIGDYANKLESAFSNVFKDLILAEDSINNIFNNLTNNVRDIFATGFGEALSEGLMDATGLADFFGAGMAGIRRMFSSPIKQAGGIIEDSFITGAQRAAPILSAAMITGATGTTASAATGGVAGFGGTMSSMLPFLNQPVGGVQTGMYSDLATGQLKTAGGQNAMTMGNLLGGITTGALIGYSAYQSLAARGVDKGYAGTAGGLTGVGAGLMMLGMMGGPATYWLAGIGMLLTGVGGAMSLFSKGGTTTQISEQTRTETRQVTSKIDITNKNLEIVNRNLLAIRDDLSYVMQSSYYFRERTMEDRYSIDSQRGNM